ncbi:MAG: 4-hydroxybutyrate CoA-transferase [Bryobacteraceae bacterium]|nr:4-hydroxybutyrate CoA-transferase [Bryobacteraceae bacterium]MDW8380006.1 acetyl-CoA hydrolase/transferase C-terminal domain-containing protein [Bryobacterales bacterium]
MSWQDRYRRITLSADAALAFVESGHRIYIQPGCATPETLVRALVRRAPELEDVELVHMATFGDAEYVRPEYATSFRTNSLFIGGNVRQAVARGEADYTPIFLSEIERLFQDGSLPLDGVLLQATPPDDHGYMSLGVGVDCTLNAARNARYVIVEVNDQMPRTHGDTFLHVSEVTAVVETSHPLLEMPPEPFTSLHERIAKNVAKLIPDGAVLQLGIGGIPNAVLHCLGGRRDLGLHTEMFSDGVIDLIESGVMNGRRKNLHPGKLVAGFVLGTERLFRFVHDNPLFEFHPISYTNDPFIIAQNDRMVAINSALEVDLTGQVCADSIGPLPYSGFGGQVDFIRGAARSRGGMPIIALPSTAKNGTVSRIKPMLTPGAGVVTSRADVHYVVTEHGIAHLHGKTLRQRAEALIAIADPKFRPELEDFARQAGFLNARTSSRAAKFTSF